MELRELYNETMNLFGISSINELSGKLLDACMNQDYQKFDKFYEMVNQDLSIDWLQMIFQYYQADRKDKKQDYTPKTLAKMVSMLTGNPDVVIDLCAGSGALAIQKWNDNHEQRFKLYEIDKKVIPYLLFSMVLRNIDCDVMRADALQNEVYEQYAIRKGDKYGKVTLVK